MVSSCAASPCFVVRLVPTLTNSSKDQTAQLCCNSLQYGMLPALLQEDSSDDLEEDSEDKETTSDDSERDSMTVAAPGRLSGSSLIAVHLDLQGDRLAASVVCGCRGSHSAPSAPPLPFPVYVCVTVKQSPNGDLWPVCH